MPIYWLEKEGDIPKLAHKAKGFIESDPQAFSNWVKEKLQLANQKQFGQLLRLIRFAKAWKNFRETENGSLRLPSGFLLTVLFCEEYESADNDDTSLKRTLERIYSRLENKYECKRPTIPIDEDLLEKYSKDSFLPELKKFRDWASEANALECEKAASEVWRKCFGDRFPLGQELKKDSKATPLIAVQSTELKSVNPSRPYYAYFNRN